MSGCRFLVPLPLLACASCASSSYLAGRITDCRDSTPLEGADVQLTSQAPGAAWNATETGGDGAYAFQVRPDVMPVTLTAAKKGFRSVQKSYPAAPAGRQDVCMQATVR